jgi:hypothetical protein
MQLLKVLTSLKDEKLHGISSPCSISPSSIVTMKVIKNKLI